MRQKPRRGFTLVELLIVIAIIAVLVSILMPALSRARESARQIVCMNNEREILLACMSYANNSHGMLPLPTYMPTNAQTDFFGIDRNSIAIVETASGGGSLYSVKYSWDHGTLWAWYGSKDLGVREKMFNCPDDLGKRNTNFSYTFNGEMFLAKSGFEYWVSGHDLYNIKPPAGTTLGGIREPAHKILVVEEEKPVDEYSDFFMAMALSNLEARQLVTSRHLGYGNMGMADGHVERLAPADLPCATKNNSIGQALRSKVPEWQYWCNLH